jgi:DeoR family transcriptional regulator, fructose operon transcriptional repressor
MAISKTEKRRKAMLGLISGGDTNVEALSRHFNVSESTIRRDLAELATHGSILRTYGGAALLRDDRNEASLDERLHLHTLEKEAIAHCAARQINDGDSLILDAGTTATALARALSGRENLQIVTNNLGAFGVLVHEAGVALTMLGGSVRRLSMGTVGPLAEMVLSRLTVDKVFLGADGLAAGRGLCEASQEQAALKTKMINQAEKVYVLADASKLGYTGQQAWTPLERPWTLITDASASPEKLAPFLANPLVTVLVADKRS